MNGRQPFMQVVILCGGKGTRLRGQTENRPKPMIEIGNRPILWHIMQSYACYGFKDFVLCLGYKGEMIKQYFLNYNKWLNDFRIDLSGDTIEILNGPRTEDWRIALINTGDEAMTGSRVKRIEPYVTGDTFMLTYGDGVSDIDLGNLVRFHESHGKIGTVTGVSPPSRYGELSIEGDEVTSFAEKPIGRHQAFINGGYFVFKREIFNYLEDDGNCILEREPLERLTQDNQLKVYQHLGFWQCMDTPRDYEYLKELWQGEDVPWAVWQKIKEK